MNRIRFVVAGAIAALVSFTAPLHALDLKGKAITVIVPSPPAGFLEISGRIIFPAFTKRTGIPIVMDFRPGGGGAVGVMALKQARPNGLTLLMSHSAINSITPVLEAKLPYDPIGDFAPITTTVYSPTVFAVPAKSPVKSMADLVALADSKGGGISFGSAGVGTSSHIVGELLRVASGKRMVHIPYKGTGPMIIDLVEGRLDFAATAYSALKSHLNEGQLRPLAVPASERLVNIPDVPTTAEAGYPAAVLDYWAGLFAPAGTPQGLVDELSKEFNATLSDPAVVKTLRDQGLIVKGNTPAEFRAQIQAELKSFSITLKAAGPAK